MLFESRSIEGTRLISLSSLKHPTSLSRRGCKNQHYLARSSFLAYKFCHISSEGSIVSKIHKSNTRAYRLHSVDVIISGLSPLLRPGVFLSDRQTDRQIDRQTELQTEPIL